MELNGNLEIKGSSSEPVLDSIQDSDAVNDFSRAHTQGILRFSNGLKIQWNMFTALANTTTQVALVEAYTLAQIMVIGSPNYLSSGSNDNQFSRSFFIDSSGSGLTHISCVNADDVDQPMTYISFGLDEV